MSADAGDIAVRNAVVLFTSAGYPAGGDAPVQFAVANNGREPVRLVEATSEGAAPVVLVSAVPVLVGAPESPSPSASGSAPPDGGGAVELTLAPGELVNVTLQVTGLVEALNGTSSVPLTLAFDNGAEMALMVPMAEPEQPLPREPSVVEEAGEH